MNKRADRTGSVTRIADGRFWARGPTDAASGKRTSFGFYATEGEAEGVLCAAGQEKKGLAFSGTAGSFVELGRWVLDMRERNGIRGIDQERRRFDFHLANASFALMRVEDIRPRHIAKWLQDEMSVKRAMQGRRGQKSVESKRPIARATIKRCLALASAVFKEAGPQGLDRIQTNPCRDLRVKRRPGVEATKDAEVFLALEEQISVRDCEEIPELDRRFILFAFGCGVRRGEQFNVELVDVHVDVAGDEHVIVRFGSDGKPRKNAKGPLRVPLFGFALEATRAQLLALKSQPNPLGLLWPTALGHRRRGKPLGTGSFHRVELGGTHVYPPGRKSPKRVPRGKGTHVYVDRFKTLLALAGISRHVRWHDLRHTCASALLQGQWGDAWTLEEVRGQLGHSSVKVTEKYAHLGETALKKAAKKVTIDTGVSGDPYRTPAHPEKPPVAPVPPPMKPVLSAPSVGGALVTGASEGDPGVAAISSDINEVGRAGHDPATYGLKGPGLLEMLRVLSAENGPHNQLITNLATTLATLLEKPTP